MRKTDKGTLAQLLSLQRGTLNRVPRQNLKDQARRIRKSLCRSIEEH